MYNDVSCESCPSGTYSPQALQDACLDCAGGFYTGASEGATTCSSCDGGRYSEGVAVDCSTCRSGTYSYTGSASCITCDAGYYSEEASSACTRCDIGTWSNTSAASCASCNPGTYSGTGAASCTDCEAGKWSNRSASSCESCVGGRWSNASASSCIVCVAGKYSSEGDPACDACELGKYSGKGEITCIACQAGTYQDQRGSDTCLNCTRGRYSDRTGADTCSPAIQGTYCPRVGMTTPDKCASASEFGSEYTSDEGSDTCGVCIAAYYMNADGKCIEKGKGVIKEAGTAGTTLSTMSIEEGYWRYTSTSTQVYECTYPMNCEGGVNGSVGDLICSKGSRGPLCTVCSDDGPGYFIDTHQQMCVACSAEQVPWYTWAVVALLAAAVIGGLVAMALKLKDTRARLRQWVRANHDSLGRLSDTFTVAWVTMQTLVLVVQNHKDSGGKDPPSLYANFLSSFAGFVSLEFFSIFPGTDCWYKGHIWSLMGNTIAAFALAFGSLALFYYKKRSGNPTAWRVLKRLVWISKLLLPAISLTISRTFRCDTYDENESTEIRRLSVDQSVDCESSYYKLMFFYALVMVAIFPVGVPLIWLIKLRALRDRFARFEVPAIEREGDTVQGGGEGQGQGRGQGQGSGASGSASSGKTTIDINDPVLSVSPLQSLFRGIKPQYASYYEVIEPAAAHRTPPTTPPPTPRHPPSHLPRPSPNPRAI